MQITWTACKTYAEARDYSRIIYLHEWDGKPFYWGKAHNSHFGGHKREIDGLEASGRYNSGYRHWIEGCLRHGAKLYVGRLDAEALECIDEVEHYLIRTYGHEVNTRVKDSVRQLAIVHVGDVPDSIRNHRPAALPACPP
jgi:hypothetical protein